MYKLCYYKLLNYKKMYLIQAVVWTEFILHPNVIRIYYFVNSHYNNTPIRLYGIG
jgi:hypothetical protein